jgi:cytoskeletal protein CcmA (bactofilin family)
VAWVGKSILFRGDVIGLEDMAIDGRVEGTIELRDHTLTIGPDAQIRADIEAKVVTVLGAVVGTITASDTIDIRETGSVEGDITARRLTMADGAVVRGRVDAGASRPTERPGQEPQFKAGRVVHRSNSTLTDSPMWIRRIASARSGAIERIVMLGNRFSRGTGTVSVVTISAMSG